MFGRIGPFELILILAIALVVFGPSKLPQVGKSLGEAIREFRKGTSEAMSSKPEEKKAEEKPAETKTEETK